ncbi:EamA family transporter [Aureibacter tunicatorum]|uniref:Drug/metabolite transporter (DMT)-like permease n=1 Tax=Aureibacter tunicatorum TaxID=866807 RepID=A0AAE4BRH7_9BACT|nr:EamA family transporter [Aureibacter tunicatorum]MDR6238676.1 drug/metabolite transporter (DMT)-like permease [Aureibacter tunicatorum]BDD05393.1 hypothetical protein AUTU_28760 [Aureibacter tunicatorum]
MEFLWLSVMFSVVNGATFKVFKKQEIDTFQAIVVNYFMALFLGVMLSSNEFSPSHFMQPQWALYSVAIGAMLIGTFFIMGLTAQKVGISVTQVASKMAVIVVVIHAVFYFGESIPWLKGLGIVLAVLGVILSSISSKSSGFDRKYTYLPFLLFLLAGVLDTTFNVAKKLHINEGHNEYFLASTFLVAGMIGVAVEAYNIFWKAKKVKLKNVIGGLLLGMFNFGSIYFLIKALGVPDWDSSTIFPVRNMSVVAFSVIAGFAFFKEKYSKLNWLGIVMALLAIYLIGK